MKKALARFARQSPALVVAMIALFVALTGTAVATTSALITGNQIKNNSITGLDVKNRSLRPIDFRGSVRGPRGLRGLPGAQGIQGIQGIQGPKGDKGDKGDTGNAGPPGLSGYQRVGDNTASNTTVVKSLTVSCPDGTKALGGGVTYAKTNTEVIVTASWANSETGWFGQARSTDGGSWSLHVWVQCATVAA